MLEPEIKVRVGDETQLQVKGDAREEEEEEESSDEERESYSSPISSCAPLPERRPVY